MKTDQSSRSTAAGEGRPLPGARHAVVWLDHAEATIIRYTQGESREQVPEVLIVGPGLAKTAFERYVRKHHPSLAGHIVGVETVDHPTAGQILKYSKQYFLGVDQLLGDRPS